MAAAQRLATATSIDLAVARSHADKRTPAQTPIQRTVTIGAPGTRGLRTYVQLFVVIASANDVRCDVASNSTFVYAYGFAEDIDATHALYASLVVQMVRASDGYISSGAHRPTPTITARLNFQLAFGARIGHRLTEAREQMQRDAKKDRRRPPGTAIAVRNKDLELRDYYGTASRARGTWQASRATAGYSSAARRAGDRAGGRRARPGRRLRALRGALRVGTVNAGASSARDWQRADDARRSTPTQAHPGEASERHRCVCRSVPPRRGIICAGLAARQSLCRRRIRADIVRPRRQTRITQRGVLRRAVDTAARGAVRVGVRGPALYRRGAGLARGATAVARSGAPDGPGTPGRNRGSLRKPQRHRRYRGSRSRHRQLGDA